MNRAETNTSPSFRVEAIKREELLRGIQIYKDFPELDVTVFSIQNSKLPDYNMYKKIQNLQPDELNPSYRVERNSAEQEASDMPEVL